MIQLAPDSERRHGWHNDYYFPGFVRSIWKFGPARITRDRKYLDRTNSTLETEGWIVSLPSGKQRLGIKYERDI